jgi:hypothetical protein
MILGINLTLLIGPTVAIPAPPDITEAVQSVSVTHNDEGRSGFQIVLQVGRAGPTDLLDYRLLLNPLLRPFNRVILVVIFNAIPRVLIDGVITNQQFSPGSQPGAATLTLTGEDVSLMMDMKKRRAEYPAMNEMMIATMLIASYAQYGLIPMIIPPTTIDQPLPTERTPVQQGTDLEYLKQMAGRYGYVFYVETGPAPFTNFAYWGPPVRTGLPQRALSVNVGPESNVDSINFTYNGLAPTIVEDTIQDRQTNQQMPVVTFMSTRMPPLVSMPALLFNQPNVRTNLLENANGLSYAQAIARAQALTDRSVDAVVSASGELDALRYGDLLRPRGIVGLRGAGFTYDGLYYVKSVSHSISKGQYKQRFNLTREGTGAMTPMVIP